MNRLLMLLLRMIIVVALLVSVIGLPLSIFLEFQEGDRWLFYFKLYPHMVLFPLLSFGSVAITLYQAFSLIRKKQKLFRNRLVVVCISLLLSFPLLFIEITSNNMMFFELKNTAQSTVSISREVMDTIQKIPANIIDISQNISENKITVSKLDIERALNNFRKQESELKEDEKQAYYQLMQLSLSYQIWQEQYQKFSFSRKLYEFSFFIITSASIMNWILLFLYSSREVRYPNVYLNKLVISSLLFFIWVPLRFYYNLITKKTLFGFTFAIGHFDVFAFVIYPLFFFFLCLRIYKTRQDWLTILGIVLLVSLMTTIGRFKPEWISFMFGLQSHPILWLIIMILEIVYCFNQLKFIQLIRSSSD